MHPDPLAGRDPSERALAPDERRILAVFCVVLFGAFLVEVFGSFEPAKLSALLFPPAWAALTAVHEAGHAVAARLCGWRVTGVVVGFGRVVSRFQVVGVPVELRLFPISGYTIPVPVRMRGLRAANAFVYAAGPGVELLLAGGVVAVVGLETTTTPSDAFVVIAAQSFVAAALVGAAINLLPHGGPDGSWSDGLGLLMSPFLTEGHFEQRMVAGTVLEALARQQAGDLDGAVAILEPELDRYPRAALLHALHARLVADQGHRTQALLLVQARLRDPALTGWERQALEATLHGLRDTR